MMQSFSICCLVTVLWVVIGYSLAFTEDSPWLGGTTRFALEGLFYAKGGQVSVSHLAPTIPESVFMMYQLMFAIITPALITGLNVQNGNICFQAVADAHQLPFVPPDCD